MEENHKRILATFRTTTKYKNTDGKAESIDLIIQRYRMMGYTIAGIDGSKQDLISNIHPFLFFNYVIDWEKVPDTRVPKGFHSGKEFGLEVIRKWQDYCWKNKIWNYDSFKVFRSYDDLKNTIDGILGDGLYMMGGDYYDLQIKVTATKQEKLDAEEAAKAKEEQELKEKQELLEAENKAREAQRIADELRRKQMHDEAQQTAQFYKEMQAKPNSPLSRDDQEPKDENPFKATEHSVIEDVASPFEVTDEAFIACPVPEPNTRQLILKRSAYEGFEFVHGEKIPKKGIITPRSINGELYICWERNISDASTNAQEALWSYYRAKSYIAFTLRDNISKNPDVTAMPISSIIVDGMKM